MAYSILGMRVSAPPPRFDVIGIKTPQEVLSQIAADQKMMIWNAAIDWVREHGTRASSADVVVLTNGDLDRFLVNS